MEGLRKLNVSLLGEKTKIEIEVLERSYPDSTNNWDKNWITSVVHITIPGYVAQFTCELRTDELAEFADELAVMHENLEGTAAFKHIEGAICMKGTIDHLGRILWEAETCYPPGDGAVLQFEFNSDQSYLTSLIRQLHTILSSFPVIEER